MTTLRLRLEGREGAVTFEALVRSMRRSLNLLQDVDRVISGQAGGGTVWTLADLGMNSPSPVAVLNGAPRGQVGEERLTERVTAGFVGALATAERGEALPGNVSELGLNHLRYLASGLGRDSVTAFEAAYVEGELSARISHEASENVKRLIVPKSRAIGSILGRLEVVNVHEGYRFHVYDDVTRRAVRCAFHEEQLGEVKAALGARVAVAGIIHRNTRGQPLRIDRPQLTVIPPEDELPTTDQLIGIDRDFTGDLSTDEYVRQQRDG